MSQIIVSFPDYPALTLANDNFGEGFALVDVMNWFDGTEARNINESRPDADGDFDQDPVYSDARYPIVVGRVRYADEAQLFAARKIVAKLWARRGSFNLQVVSPEGTQTAEVTRAGKPTWDLWKPGRAEFRLPFKAADPRKYGPLKSLSTGLPVAGGGVASPLQSPLQELGGGNPGRVIITNSGSTDSSPIFKVTGGLDQGVEIIWVESGDRVRLEWPLTTANVAEFDTATGQVWLDGQSPIAGYLTKAQWRSLAAGETATIQFVGLGVVSGTPQLSVEWREADA